MADKANKKGKAFFIAHTALISAVAIALSALETMIPPLPMIPPGGKAGFSNIAVMLGADVLGLPSAVFIALVKAIFAGTTRGFTAFLMSFSGGILSTVVMAVLLRYATKKIGYIGIGICGAATHNTAQLIVSSILTTNAVFIYIPALLILSIVTGLLTGLLLGLIIPHYRKICKIS